MATVDGVYGKWMMEEKRNEPKHSIFWWENETQPCVLNVEKVELEIGEEEEVTWFRLEPLTDN